MAFFIKNMEDQNQKLREQINETKMARLNSSKRLSSHDQVSQWIIISMAAFLIILPLLKVPAPDSNNFNLIQSVTAILLLIYSLVIPGKRLYYRSREMHKCALELDLLLSKLDQQKDAQHYAAFYEEYTRVLQKYENHTTVDLSPVKLEFSKQKGDETNAVKKIFGFIKDNFQVFVNGVKYLLGYFYYSPVILLFAYFLLKYVKPGLISAPE